MPSGFPEAFHTRDNKQLQKSNTFRNSGQSMNLVHQGLEGKEARDALEACTLVSHSFSAISRKYLLSAVVISESVPSQSGKRPRRSYSAKALHRRLKALSALIESKSDFKHLIRKIHVKLGTQAILFRGASGLYLVLGALASHAKNLETLWISGNKMLPIPISWPDSRRSISQPLNNLLRSVKFRQLRIANLSHLPTDLFMTCPSVQNLHLVSTGFWQAENVSPQSIFRSASVCTVVKELELQLCTNHFSENLSQLNIDLSGLQRLRAQIEGHRDVVGARDLIEKAQLSLKSLELMLLAPNPVVTHVQPLANSIDISRLQKLVDLQLNIDIEIAGAMPSMEDIFGLLTHTSCPSQLQSIEVNLNATVAVHGVYFCFWNCDPAWTDLDPAKLRKKHPLLQSVSVKFYLRVNFEPYDPEPLSESILKWIRCQLINVILPGGPTFQSVLPAGLNVVVVIC
ncbi:hypothetical protein GALMADRAFT_213994 [Galerina marginata CBS 339.88]|uniref:F-box domain-containing protein n=1 Tax=Galerina marginata (strain CBS 339.88) TaxID=685588 RepID=A0A067SX23_GALM3|nr:hypothetical protein GALMADRAFT_213994 [Galerina marginata CBS 339.88]